MLAMPTTSRLRVWPGAATQRRVNTVKCGDSTPWVPPDIRHQGAAVDERLHAAQVAGAAAGHPKDVDLPGTAHRGTSAAGSAFGRTPGGAFTMALL